MGVSENLKRGVTEIVLLALLSQQDMYGYEMAQAMRERSHEKFTLLEHRCIRPCTDCRTTGIFRLGKSWWANAASVLTTIWNPPGGHISKNLCGVYDSSAGRTGNSDQLSGRGDRYCTV